MNCIKNIDIKKQQKEPSPVLFKITLNNSMSLCLDYHIWVIYIT